MTEKRRPHHDLEAFKDAFVVRKVARMSIPAARDAVELGFDIAAVRQIVLTIKARHFYKSMTSFRDHRSWQDVYHVPTDIGIIYLKFTDDHVTEFKLLSFKER